MGAKNWSLPEMSGITTYVRFAPLYEAMSVCTQTLEELKRQDAEREQADLLESVIRGVQATRKFIRTATSDKDILAEAGKDQVSNIVSCVSILMAMMECTSKRTREILPTISARYRDALAATLDDGDKAVEEVEDIVEAWSVCADEDLLSKISEALKEIDAGKADITDWRKALESIPD
jgi:hypothetical protein